MPGVVGLLVGEIEIPVDDMDQAVPLLGLARCNRLLQGMVAVKDARLPDLVGVFVRPVMETWLISMYVLLGDVTASRVVLGDFLFHVRRFAGKETDLRKLVESWPDEPAQFQWPDITSKVLALVDERESFPEHAEAAALLYRFYRWVSTWELHGTVGSMLGHADAISGRPVEIRAEREGTDPTLHIQIAAFFTGSLGSSIAEVHDVETDPIDPLLDEIMGDRSFRSLLAQLFNNDLP